MMDVPLLDAFVQALQSRADAWLLAVPVLKGLSLALWTLVAVSVLQLWVGARAAATH